MEGRYDHVAVPGSATVLARDGDNVMLTHQWIYTHGDTEWRLPSGRVVGGDAGPEHAASSRRRPASPRARPGPRPSEADLDCRWLPFLKALELVTGGQIRHAGSVFVLLYVAVRGV